MCVYRFSNVCHWEPWLLCLLYLWDIDLYNTHLLHYKPLSLISSSSHPFIYHFLFIIKKRFLLQDLSFRVATSSLILEHL